MMPLGDKLSGISFQLHYKELLLQWSDLFDSPHSFYDSDWKDYLKNLWNDNNNVQLKWNFFFNKNIYTLEFV